MGKKFEEKLTISDLKVIYKGYQRNINELLDELYYADVAPIENINSINKKLRTKLREIQEVKLAIVKKTIDNINAGGI